ncbi:hypothetical protein PRIPAC_84565 [Pristionchus pacificus]|nr:hypothetical protein PRIPAC_84565 [Pristionchus pacificus]
MTDELVIRWEVEGVSKLTSKWHFSPYHRHRNLPWRLLVCTEKSSRTKNVNHFSVYLCCNDESECELWNCEQSTKVTLINRRNESKNITKDITKNFQGKTDGWGRPDFFEFFELLEPSQGFIKDDKVIVEARTSVKAVHSIREEAVLDFSQPTANADNVVLKLNDGVVNVCRKYMCFHSPYFASLFYPENETRGVTEENEIELKDVSVKDLIELLNIIYPSERQINHDSYKPILKLAQRFQIERALELTETYLIHSKRVTNAEKMFLAEEYGLQTLMVHCFDNIKTLQEIKNIEADKEYSKFPVKLKVSVLNKAFELIK